MAAQRQCSIGWVSSVGSCGSSWLLGVFSRVVLSSSWCDLRHSSSRGTICSIFNSIGICIKIQICKIQNWYYYNRIIYYNTFSIKIYMRRETSLGYRLNRVRAPSMVSLLVLVQVRRVFWAGLLAVLIFAFLLIWMNYSRSHLPNTALR